MKNFVPKLNIDIQLIGTLFVRNTKYHDIEILRSEFTVLQ